MEMGVTFKSVRIVIISILFVATFSTCKKEEGFGGKTTIKGKIIEQIYDADLSTLQSTRPCADEDVYIVFGNNNFYDEDVKTSASGDFEFKYLLPGSYKIYYYSLDTANHASGNKIAIIKEFTISKGDTEIDLGTLISISTVDYDEGNAIVKGKITEYLYDNDFLTLHKTQPAMDEDVFISKLNSDVVLIDTKTSSTGDFEFKYLLPGDYKIFYYSLDSTNQLPWTKVPVIKQFTVLEGDSIIDLGTFKMLNTVDSDEGKATVRGKITEYLYDNNFSVFQKALPAMDEDVFITNGSSTQVLDDTKTSADGDFEFKNLLPGNYKIFYYSEDSINHIPNQNIAIVKEFSISESDAIVDMGNLRKLRGLDYNDGSATIKGVFMTKYFINNFTFIREVSPSQNEDVFLIYNDHPYIEERIRTMYDGSYAFPNLIKGKYKIYALSDNPNGTSQKLQVFREITITQENQIVTMDTLFINNK